VFHNYQYPFVFQMTVRQLKQFNVEMENRDSPATKVFIDQMQMKNGVTTPFLCGCFERNKYCIPCRHML
jgi:hypothetical protein